MIKYIFTTIEIKVIKRIFIIFSLVFSYFAANSQQMTFTKLKSTETGVDFANQLNETEEASSLLYDNFYSGGGVAIGDVNNDGLPDVFFAGNQVNDKLYINQGDLKFKDATIQSGIIQSDKWSTGVVMADINADGWLDIYVCKSIYEEKDSLRANEFYLNNGNGTFTEMAEKWGIASTQRSQQATFLDYDKDGDLDLFLVNQPPNPGIFSPLKGYDWRSPKFSCQLFQNLGGEFIDVSIFAGVNSKGYGLSVSAADFNNDSWIDLYVSNDYNSPDFLYINQQNGTFKNTLNESMGHTSFFSMGTDAADINNDGWLDISVVDMVAEDNYRLKANMGGMEPESFWATVKEGGHFQYMFNSLQLNRGMDSDGLVHFTDIAQMAGVAYSDWSWTPLIADFDNDGDKDLYCTNGLVRDLRNTDAVDQLQNYYEAAILKYQNENPEITDVQMWDLIDYQVALDLFPSQPLANYFFENKGSELLKFENKADKIGVADKGFSTGAAYADLDLDGDLDLVVNNLNSEAWIYKNETKGNYLRIEPHQAGKKHIGIGSRIEVIQNGKKQVAEITSARGFYSSSENSVVHFGFPNAKNLESLTIKWSDGTITNRKDVKINQILKVDKSEEYSNSESPTNYTYKNESSTYLPQWKHVENKFDDYEREVLLPHKMSQIGPALAVADINSDGLEDLFFGGAKGFPSIMMLQGQDGKMSLSTNPIFINDKNYEDVDAAFFDADNDGDMDLYVVSGGNESTAYDSTFADRLYINDKGNWILSDALPAVFESGSVVRPFDYDKDGDMDLFIGGRQVPGAYPSPANSYLLKNMFKETKRLQFQDVTKTNAPAMNKLGMVTDAIWTDYDKDKDMDLVITGEWMPITVFENKKGQFTKTTPVKSSNGWWYSVEAIDLDNDGDQDYLLGNLGLNSKYKASAQEPFSVHYDDFDENGSFDIVLSYYNFGKKYPVRGRSCSSEQIPDIQDKFPTYDLFAQADVFEVYGEENLKQALNLDVYCFENSWIENTGKGSFKRHTLPRLAQVSSINDWLVINEDKQKTIISAGNLLNTEVETPRQDGNVGLILSADSKGKLTTVLPSESGLYLPKEVKQLKKIVIKGETKILVVRNNDLLELWGKNVDTK